MKALTVIQRWSERPSGRVHQFVHIDVLNFLAIYFSNILNNANYLFLIIFIITQCQSRCLYRSDLSDGRLCRPTRCIRPTLRYQSWAISARLADAKELCALAEFRTGHAFSVVPFLCQTMMTCSPCQTTACFVIPSNMLALSVFQTVKFKIIDSDKKVVKQN